MNRFKELSFESLLDNEGVWGTEYETDRRMISHNGLTFWECGRVDLNHDFGNMPDERRVLERETNLSIQSSNESLPYTMVAPDGSALPKSWIANQCMLLLDDYAGVVIRAERNWHTSTQVSWLSATAFPCIGTPIEFMVPDKVAEKAVWKEVFDERWHEAQVLKEMDAVPTTNGESCAQGDCIRTCRHGWVMQRLAGMSKGEVIERYVRPVTSEKRAFDFVRIK